MAIQALDGELLFTVSNVVPFTKQGTAFVVGGSFVTTPGIVPSQELQPSTNTVLGYFNGQMLAYSAGDGAGIYAGQTAGALINFDPASSDTGQAVWNKLIIVDCGLVTPLLINTTFVGTVQVAGPNQNWVIRTQFLYAGSTPALDVAVVQTALTSAGVSRSRQETPAGTGATEQVFAY